MNAPTLKTRRLILRPMLFSDWPKYQAFWSTERSTFMEGPLSPKKSWGVFCHDIAQWSLFGHGALMLETADGDCVGQVGINDGPLFPEKELGWLLYDGFEGKGYALEAAAAMHRWAFQERHFDTLVSYIDPNNFRSAKIAEKLNGVLDKTAPRTVPEDLVYRYVAHGQDL